MLLQLINFCNYCISQLVLQSINCVIDLIAQPYQEAHCTILMMYYCLYYKVDSMPVLFSSSYSFTSVVPQFLSYIPRD